MQRRHRDLCKPRRCVSTNLPARLASSLLARDGTQGPAPGASALIGADGAASSFKMQAEWPNVDQICSGQHLALCMSRRRRCPPPAGLNRTPCLAVTLSATNSRHPGQFQLTGGLPSPGYTLHFELARMAAQPLHINQLPDDLLLRILTEALSDSQNARWDIGCASAASAACPFGMLLSVVFLPAKLPACTI